MNFSLQRNIRIAGSVVILIGCVLNNWLVVVFANLIVAVSYMWSVAKIENHLKEEEDDASSEER